MATLKDITAKGKILEEQLFIDFKPIKDVKVTYTLTGNLIEQYQENQKQMSTKLFEKISKELIKVKGIHTNGQNFHKLLAIALENLGEEYINEINKQMELERAEALVYSFDETPTKEEFMAYFSTLSDDKKIIDLFYLNFMKDCYQEFSDLMKKFESAKMDDKVGK